MSRLIVVSLLLSGIVDNMIGILSLILIILGIAYLWLIWFAGWGGESNNIDPPGYQPDHYEDDDHNNGWP